MGYDLYPAVDETYNFPVEVRRALAASAELRSLVIPMTTAVRNNLLPAELWDGRTIANTTTDRLERYDAGTTTWYSIMEYNDVKQYVDTSRVGKNRLINGDFSINQRKLTSHTNNNGYGFDRWYLGTAGGVSTYSCQTPALGELPESARSFARLVTTGHSTTGSFAILYQKIEGVRTLAGKTVTVSFWAKAASGTPKVAVAFEQDFRSGSGGSTLVVTHVGKVTLSTTWQRYSVTGLVPNINGKTIGTDQKDCLALGLWVSGGSLWDGSTGGLGLQNGTFDFWGVQVEEGPVASLFEHLNWAESLVLCQRYLFRIDSPSSSYFPPIWGQAMSPNSASYMVTYPTTMRAGCTFSRSGNLAPWSANGSVLPAFTGFVVDPTTTAWDGAGLAGTGSSGLVAGDATGLNMQLNGGYLQFDAEL